MWHKKWFKALVALIMLGAWLGAAVLLHQFTFGTLVRAGAMLPSEALLGSDTVIALVVLIKRKLPTNRQASALRLVNNLGSVIRVALMVVGPILMMHFPWIVPLSGGVIFWAALGALKIEEEDDEGILNSDVSVSKLLYVLTIMMGLGIITTTNLDNMAAIINWSRGSWFLVALGIFFNLLYPHVAGKKVNDVLDKYQQARYGIAVVLAALAAYIIVSWSVVASWHIDIVIYMVAEAGVGGMILWLLWHNKRAARSV